MGIFNFRTSPKPENKLEELLVEASRNITKRSDFYRMLLDSPLFAIGFAEGDIQGCHKGDVIVKKGSKIGFRHLETQGGKATPIFSSLKRLKEWAKDEVDYVSLKGIDIFKIVIKDPDMNIVLNPQSSFGKAFGVEEIRAILDSSIFELLDRRDRIIELSADTKLLMGQPAVFPVELVEKIVSYLKTSTDVKKAFLTQIYIENEVYQPHPLIAIQMVENPSKTFKAIQAEISPMLKGLSVSGELIDFLELEAKTDLTTPIFKNFKIIFSK